MAAHTSSGDHARALCSPLPLARLSAQQILQSRPLHRAPASPGFGIVCADAPGHRFERLASKAGQCNALGGMEAWSSLMGGGWWDKTPISIGVEDVRGGGRDTSYATKKGDSPLHSSRQLSSHVSFLIHRGPHRPSGLPRAGRVGSEACCSCAVRRCSSPSPVPCSRRTLLGLSQDWRWYSFSCYGRERRSV